MSKERKGDKRGLSALWPKITDEKAARDAAKFGVTSAALVATITAAISLYSAYSGPTFGLSIWSLFDALLFGAIAFGIWRMSRVAALFGLCLYLFEQWYRLTTVGETGNGAMIAFFILFFINGIRGTFAYHRFRGNKESTAEEEI